MPIYVFKCEKGHQFDEFLKLADYDNPMTCPECGESAKRQIVPTMINFDMQPWDSYISPASGKLITSYKDRKRDMAETGCVDYEPSLKDENKRRIEESERKLEKAMDETVEAEIEKMTPRKRELLEQDLNAGASPTVTRQ